MGLSIDEPLWDHSTFSANRDYLFSKGPARVFFERVRGLADWQRLTSNEHFSVDGTLIEARASHKRFRLKGEDGPKGSGRNLEVDFKGRHRTNDIHASTTNPEVRLFKKDEGTASRLYPLIHVLRENRNDLNLIVDVVTTGANGRPEREAALKLLARHASRGTTGGADRV